MNKINKKQWHLGFYGVIELEFREDREVLEFYREHQLSKKALSMDMLVVKKRADAALHNNIGDLFRQYNVIEYKSPKDPLGIDQFYKGLSYTCLYKSLGKYADEIKANELTLTFIRQSKPQGLFKSLRANGHTVTKKYNGIYYVTDNLMFPVQIVVSSELEAEDHLSLRILSDKAEEKDAKEFVERASLYESQGDMENAEALLSISETANQKIFEDIREEGNMNQVMRNFFKNEIEAAKKQAAAEAREQVFADAREQAEAEAEAEKKELEAENERLKEEIKRLKLAML